MKARSRALFKVLILPWLVLIGLLSLGGLFGSVAGTPWIQDWKFVHFLGLWLILGLGNNLFFAVDARRKLYRDFRILATDRFPSGQTLRQDRVSLWQRMCIAISAKG